jgi:hypothetical protein
MSQQEEIAAVDPHETLYLPLRKRFMSEIVTTPEGTRELRIYYGLKEITIEEPELMSFGENLLKQDHFIAGSATQWSQGEPYPWERVKGLLEMLLAEDILSRQEIKPSNETDYHKEMLEREAKRQAPTEPMWWIPDCAQVMQKLTGRPLELGYLEAMLPVHRVAHAALDQEGRHIGEGNVFPLNMRMKMETEFRTCPYPGSRYRDDALMNVTALKSMTKHWKPTLRLLLTCREAFLKQYPLRPDGRWGLGDLHAVTCAVLALPTYLLMRAKNPVANGDVDPVLSSLFRTTDGVRMVAIYLLFLPEAPMTYDTPISAEELLHVTERDNHFLSTRGVCAGPPHMVEEFLATLMGGKPVAGEPGPASPWEPAIRTAMDYGLRGIQHYSLQFNLWSHMCRAYEQLRTAMLDVPEGTDDVWGKLRKRLERDWKIIMPTRLHTATQRDWAEARYIEMFDRAQRGLQGFREESLVSLKDVFTPVKDEVDANTRQQLRELIRSRAGTPPAGKSDLPDIIADATADFLAMDRSALGALEDVQRQVNALLERPHPERRFASTDLSLHHRLRAGTIGVMPYLMDVFRDVFGITIESTRETTRIGVKAAA